MAFRGRSGCRLGEKGMGAVKRITPHVDHIQSTWDFWHTSRMLTWSVDRLQAGTDQTESAQLLTCRRLHVNMKTKIAFYGPQVYAIFQNDMFFPSHLTSGEMRRQHEALTCFGWLVRWPKKTKRIQREYLKFHWNLCLLVTEITSMEFEWLICINPHNLVFTGRQELLNPSTDTLVWSCQSRSPTLRSSWVGGVFVEA